MEPNVIRGTAILLGTIRPVFAEKRTLLADRICELATGIATAIQATIRFVGTLALAVAGLASVAPTRMILKPPLPPERLRDQHGAALRA